MTSHIVHQPIIYQSQKCIVDKISRLCKIYFKKTHSNSFLKLHYIPEDPHKTICMCIIINKDNIDTFKFKQYFLLQS